MWLPLLKEHLPLAAFFSRVLGPKYSANEPELRGNLS